MNSGDKPFETCPGGKYDNNGFYFTPNGSFWDPDGIYFNKEGFDRHGGFYDENLEYHPGKGWIDELMCYEDEKVEVLNKVTHKGRRHRNDDDDLYDDGDEVDIDDLYEDVDIDKVLEEESKPEPESNYKIYKPAEATTNPSHHHHQQVTGSNLYQPQEDLKITQKPEISADLLFNKIPDNLKQDTKKPVEKQVEVDSLFQ